MSEKCDRCKSVGSDRRTLWMKCFYAMDELKVPFEKVELFTANNEAVNETFRSIPYTCKSYGSDGTTTEQSGEYQQSVYRTEAELHREQFFTLRVCKRCRSEWMRAISYWFHSEPQGEDHDADEPPPSIGSGIYIRENGCIKEITREEWDARNPNCPPITMQEQS